MINLKEFIIVFFMPTFFLFTSILFFTLSFAQGKSLLHCLLLRGSACCFGVAICSILLCVLRSVLCVLLCSGEKSYSVEGILLWGGNLFWEVICSGEKSYYGEVICSGEKSYSGR